MVDNPFLRDLKPEEYDLLSPLFDRVALPARMPIFRQGEPAIYMYMILQGRVTIRYKPYDGPRITLTRLRSGDVLGWSSVVGNTVYTSDAITVSAVRALRVRGEALRDLCLQYQGTGSRFLHKLATAVSPRWVHAREQVESILHHEVLAG